MRARDRVVDGVLGLPYRFSIQILHAAPHMMLELSLLDDDTPATRDLSKYSLVYEGEFRHKSEEPQEVLEAIWSDLEMGRGLVDRSKVRSFAVGDVVRLDGEYWVVATMGWKRTAVVGTPKK